MPEDFTYTNYSVEDIERYLGGRMNAKDMHDMERAALQDPFLADAIEGLQHQPFAQTYSHLDEIAAAIQGDKESAKVVVLPVKRNYWWRAAAIIAIVIMAGGVLWYSLTDKNKESKNIAVLTPAKQKVEEPAKANNTIKSDTLAAASGLTNKTNSLAATTTVNGSNKEIDYKSKTNSPVILLRDSNIVASTWAASPSIDSVRDAVASSPAANRTDVVKNIPSVATDEPMIEHKDTVFKDKLVAVAGMNVSAKNSVVSNFNTRIAKPSGPTANEVNVQTNMAANNMFVNSKHYAPAKIEGFVVDDNNKPLPEATVYTNDRKQVTLTDGKGHFTLNATDSLLAVQVTSAGYKSKQVLLSSSTPNYIAVSQDTNLLSAVVVTEFKNTGAKKAQSDTLVPEGGWQSFREYVYKKLHKEKEMDSTGNATVMGKSVEIEFEVDENGLAKDLRITKSLNTESDAKALEMVQQWPHWIATRKDKKGKVVIQF